MKLVLAAGAALVFSFGAASLAQAQSTTTPPSTVPAPTPPPVPPSRCPAFPPDVTLPDGAATTTNEADMRRADEAYQAWGRTTQTVLECRRVEAEELLAAARAHSVRVQEYNAQASRLNQVGQSWATEVAEYNQRTGRRPRR